VLHRLQRFAALQDAKLSGNNPAVLVSLGYTYAISDQRVEANKIIDQLKALSAQRYVSPANVAAVYAGLDDMDRAFEGLEMAYRCVPARWFGSTYGLKHQR